MLELLMGTILGYIVHDAVKPTPVGKVLDKIALPSDLFVSDPDKEQPTEVPA